MPQRLLILVMLCFSGCSGGIRSPRLGTLYDRLAQHRDAYRNPVIVIPGVLGSKLIDAETIRVTGAHS